MFAEHISVWIAQYGYPAIFLMLIGGIVGLPIPDQFLLILSGYLVVTKSLSLAPTLGVAILGSICGITISYALGRGSGSWLSKLSFASTRLDSARSRFERFSGWTLVFGYFIPGVRNLMGFTSGMMRLKFSKFAPYAYAGAIFSSVSCIAGGYFVGVQAASAVAGSMHPVVVLAIAVPGFFVVRKHCKTGIRRRRSAGAATASAVNPALDIETP